MSKQASIHNVFARRTPAQILQIFAFLALLALGQSANALVITASNSGWYFEDGTHDPSNVNFVAGFGYDDYYQMYAEFRNFFVFDLNSLGTFSSATLRAYLIAADETFGAGPGYISPDANETWGLFDVTTNLVDLVAGTGGVSAFSDLGGGIAYGEAIVSAGDMGSFIEVSLNADALASMAASGGLWAIGGRLLTPSSADPEVIFAWSHELPWVELVLATEVPEPASFSIIAFALLALCWMRRSSDHAT